MLRLLLTLVPSALALAAGAASAAPSVYGASAMVKVRPSTPPRADAGVDLVAARNEFASFQVVVHGGDTGATGVRARFTGLSGPGAIAGRDVTLYREGFLDIQQLTYPTSERGLWPDPLVPDVDEIAGEQRNAFPFDVPRGEARAVWVDVHVPMDAKPGVYRGEVEVTATGFSARVPVTLEVVDVTLPSTPSLATAFLLWVPNVCQAHRGSGGCNAAQAFPLVSAYERMALEHRITLSNPLPSPTQDWSLFDARYGPFLNGTADTRLPGARMTSVQYVGPRTVDGYAAFAAHFREKGWLDRAYDYTFDEPWNPQHFTEIERRAAIVRQGAPGLRTLVTTNVAAAGSQGSLGAIDLLTPLVNDLDTSGGDLRSSYDDYLHDARHGLWMYECCRSWGCGGGADPLNAPGGGWPSYAVDTSAAKNRAMQWLDFRERVTGELYYETALALPTAWTDIFRFGGNGDGTLFYPGTPAMIGGTTDVPVASVRLKLIRLGVQDYELLKMVSDAGDPSFARAQVAGVVPSSSQVPDDGAPFERAHLQLLNRLVSLRQPQPGGGTDPGTGSGQGTGSDQGTGSQPQTSGDGPPSAPPGVLAGGGGCTTTGAGLPSLWLLVVLVPFGSRLTRALARAAAWTFVRARPSERDEARQATREP